MKICPLCNVACLEPHQELLWWNKCPICAYSELTPDKDPLMRTPNIEACSQVDNLVQERFDKDTSHLPKKS
jgi:hypothetical protein